LTDTRAPADGRELGQRLRERDVTAAPAALNLIESRAPDARRQAAALLAETSPAALGHEGPAHIIGVTGPPGVGKSSLLSQLLKHWRSHQKSVAVLAVDPSSRRSGGSLLGDRARIETDPKDRHVFIRSTAAGTRLGGLAPATRSASEALAAAFDIVVIETVGVGQSETEVADAADTVAVVLQPASGDVLQFLKAGIMEVPDVLVLTKTDLGTAATRAMSDLHAALLALGAPDTEACPVPSVPPAQGIVELAQALEAHRTRVDLGLRRRQARRRHALEDFAVEHGERGLGAPGGGVKAERWLETQDPALDVPSLERALADRADSQGRG
jgi:LAO/AO transport system kinase